MIAQAETYALARALFLQWGAGSVTFMVRADGTAQPKPSAVSAGAVAAWDLATAFVTEAQRRQPEAWAVLPPPTKEQP